MGLLDHQDNRKSLFRNDTLHTLEGRIFVGPETSNDPWLKWTAAPGESFEIPTKYECALHDVRDGVIVGGDAPLLTRVSPPQNYRLHKSLFPKKELPVISTMSAEEVAAALRDETPAIGESDPDELLVAKVKAKKPKGAE